MIYRRRGEEAESRLERVIDEAVALKKALEDAELTDKEEYTLLCRVLEEQTIAVEKNGKNHNRPKNKVEIHADSLQNPSAPDVTFRRKAGKDHKGYVCNVVETVREDGLGIVTTMDLAQNIHSDSQFMRDYLAQREKDATPEIMIADGAYGGEENVRLAEENGVELVVTALTGKILTRSWACSTCLKMEHRC